MTQKFLAFIPLMVMGYLIFGTLLGAMVASIAEEAKRIRKDDRMNVGIVVGVLWPLWAPFGLLCLLCVAIWRIATAFHAVYRMIRPARVEVPAARVVR